MNDDLVTGSKKIEQIITDKMFRFEIDGETVKVASEDYCAFEYVLRPGSGPYFFDSSSLHTPSLRGFCAGLERFLMETETDCQLADDAQGAIGVVRRVSWGRETIHSRLANCYERSRARIQLPPLDTLPGLAPDELHNIIAGLQEYAHWLDYTGSRLVIEGVKALHPLTIIEDGFSACVFDPRVMRYETGSEQAWEFRESLRRNRRDYADHLK